MFICGRIRDGLFMWSRLYIERQAMTSISWKIPCTSTPYGKSRHVTLMEKYV